MVLKPSKNTFDRMHMGLEEHGKDDHTDAEHFLSDLFNTKNEVGQWDQAFNFEVHNTNLTSSGGPQGEWRWLAQHPDLINCFHFSTSPKPSTLLLGCINPKSSGSNWSYLKKDASW